MYKISSAGKAIARGDDMKRPNKFLNKKYLSSLVIAAFLILSVLTAYNIRFGNNEPDTAVTEVEETIGNNEDVISSGDSDTTKESKNDAGISEDSDYEKRSSSDVGGDTQSRQEETEESNEDTGYSDNEESKNMQDKRNTSEEEEAQTAENNFSYDGTSKMPWPVMGNVILPYSMDTTVYYTTLDQYACNDGILIGAKKGEEVMAAADGRIVNITESDRYGTTVTLLIGEYYEVFYSQVENVNYEVGDEVKEGDVIATVAEPTRSFTLEGPHLFFKMTYKGDPVNPTDYLEA